MTALFWLSLLALALTVESRKAVDEYTTAVIDDVMSCECIGPCSQVRRLKAALLRLMGVEVERWQRNEDPRDANSVMSVFTPD